MAMTSSEPVPNPVHIRDAAALVGVLAVLEGLLLGDRLEDATAQKIAERFQAAGLLEERWAARDLRRVLDDLNQRLRYALGEYDEPPGPGPAAG